MPTDLVECVTGCLLIWASTNVASKNNLNILVVMFHAVCWLLFNISQLVYSSILFWNVSIFVFLLDYTEAHPRRKCSPLLLRLLCRMPLNITSKKTALLLVGLLVGSYLDFEDGGSTFVRKVRLQPDFYSVTSKEMMLFRISGVFQPKWMVMWWEGELFIHENALQSNLTILFIRQEPSALSCATGLC